MSDESKQLSEPNPPSRRNRHRDKQKSYLTQTVDFFYDLINLQEGLDKEGTIVNIKNNKRMQGANAWLLMCSIMIASLGLDLNSPAVIIGAMLISPLMSPILGVGLAVGINDKTTLYVSLQHFGIAIAIAIVTSTLYFCFTPFGQITNEITARTAPTLLDVMVAFFGGIAGIISGSRKDKSNAIPGVAIATALMPPLCVTGFGIANGNFVYMANSFYLFFLNATFVALATYLIVRFLRFPMNQIANDQERRKTRWILISVGLLMIIPSGRILMGVLEKSRQESIVIDFVKKNFKNAIYEIERIENTDSIEIKLLAGKYYERDSITFFEAILAGKGARKFKINFLQDTESRKAIENLRSTQTNYLNVVEQSKTTQINQEKIIRQLTAVVDSLNMDTTLFRQLSLEVKTLFPDLEGFSLSHTALAINQSSGKILPIPVLLVDWHEDLTTGKNEKIRNERELKLADFIKLRIGLDTVRVGR